MEKSPSLSQATGQQGFTLLELLAAMAILTLVLIFFTEVIRNVSNVTGTGRQRLDVDASARIALDVMADDLAKQVKRRDVDFLVSKNVGNDEFYFYSEAPALSGSGSADTAAPIGYKVTTGTSGTRGLQRIGEGLLLTTGSGVASYPSRLRDYISSIPSTAIQPLCKEVIRMEVEFMKNDGTFLAALPTRSDSGEPAYSYVTASGTLGQIAANQVPDWGNIRAMVVTIVCIDREKQALLSESDLENITNTFVDAANGATSSIASAWSTVAETTHFPKIGGAVRVYRRFFPINE